MGCDDWGSAGSEAFFVSQTGSALIQFVSDYYKTDFKTMLVGTGETPAILSFYESCSFRISHRLRNFFTDNYDHPMFEGDIQLVDMIYLKKNLQ